ncbi:hypothetical protein RDV64_13765 [Acuticoccus sp. MNP-M23]|uniref:hypothetical protein n=1 Tax=Acuticoccus sp. MNP-M23 TaxID=3072793 RepID=UPI00281612B8|nr:hypothetical protein [Acuticoccus sp. MNP-M23]WMS41148.1 hypothetical protein RDV64_13765 [Acuticoccus sp. MNP-M23]
MQRRVILHIGLEKAASTSLQGALVDHRAALAANGVAFPAIGGGGAKDQRDLRLGLEGHAEPRERAVARLKSAAASDAHTLLLAGETFYRIGVAPVLEVLADGGWGGVPVAAFAVIRDAPGWLNSRYAFGAIQFRYRDGFASYARKAVRRGDVDWHRQFAPWMEAPGVAFHAVPLADRRDQRSVVVRTLEAMALSFVPEGPRRNEAVDPRTAEAARRLAAFGLARGGDAAVRPARRVLLESAAREKFDGRFQGLDAALTETIETGVRDSQNRFARAAWGADWAEIYAGAPAGPKTSNEWRRGSRPNGERAAIDRVVRDVVDARGLKKPWWAFR